MTKKDVNSKFVDDSRLLNEESVDDRMVKTECLAITIQVRRQLGDRA